MKKLETFIFILLAGGGLEGGELNQRLRALIVILEDPGLMYLHGSS